MKRDAIRRAVVVTRMKRIDAGVRVTRPNPPNKGNGDCE
jgi:hypothetical protein